MQVKKPSLFGLFSALIVCPLLAVCQSRPGTPEAAASNPVQKFAKFDFDGYRLDSDGHQAIWKLTIDDGAAPESPLFVVKGYRVGVPKKAPDASSRVPVDYEVIGLIEDGPKGAFFRPKAYVQREIFPVRCTREGCKIDLARGIFHVSPHVGKEAVLLWVKGLEGIRQTAPERQADQRLYEQVNNAR